MKALLVLGLAAVPALAANPPGYGYYCEVTIDHTKTANTDQAGFAALFDSTTSATCQASLKDAAHGGHVLSAPYDIYVTDASGALLPFEREFYNATDGALKLWYKTGISHTTDTAIRIYHGKANDTEHANPAGVWDANYKGVWHLSNGVTLSGAGSLGLTLTVYNGGAVAGVIDGGAGSTSSNLLMEGASSGIVGDSARTLGMWVKVTGNYTTPQAIASIGQGSNSFALMYLVDGFGVQANGKTRSFTWPHDSNWHHLAAAYPGGGIENVALYLDGIPQVTSGGTGVLNTDYGYTDLSYIAGGATRLTGSVDEFRISNIARSGDWFAASYNNQSSPSTFYSVALKQVNDVKDVRRRILTKLDKRHEHGAPAF